MALGILTFVDKKCSAQGKLWDFLQVIKVIAFVSILKPKIPGLYG